MAAPIKRAIGVPSGARTTLRIKKTNGTARTVAAHIPMNSPGLSFRSARAMSRARLAPKSRCSTTRLRRARATLWARMLPMPPDACVDLTDAAASGFPAA